MQPYISLSGDNHDKESQPVEKPTRDIRSSVLTGKRVVVVEDEGITQMQLRRMLKQAGLVVLDSAISGEEGVAIVLRERPDLVLMDIRMPGPFDGLEAARRILAEYHVCIVMLTAFSSKEFQQEADELHTCGYVVKPVTAQSLLPRLEEAFSKFDRH